MFSERWKRLSYYRTGVARILVIEPATEVHRLLADNLAQDGCRIEQASTVEAGLSCANAHRCDAIVLDLRLNGLELCRRLKTGRETSDIPLILLTARGEDEQTITGLELGADFFFDRSLNPQVLVALVRSLCRKVRRQQTTAEFPITVGKIAILPTQHEVRIDGREIQLSTTEFGILRLLAGSPGRVFGRASIIDEIFDRDSTVTGRAVDVHIAGLRKKLGPCKNYIHTVRGVGYRFKSPDCVGSLIAE
jgi:two-component system phosphate regulon response regulator PhoB